MLTINHTNSGTIPYQSAKNNTSICKFMSCLPRISPQNNIPPYHEIPKVSKFPMKHSDPILAQLIDANQQKPEASRGGGNQ